MIALASHLPRVRVPWVALGVWPTPLTALTIEGRPVWIKHEGDSHPRYGGNKIRTLEAWLGHAQARGARRIWAIGAYGSNHAVATVIHAPAAGLDAGAMVFPQPYSRWAAENCGALVASGCPLIRVRNVIEMPFAAWRLARREPDSLVMPPGGATPIGTFGALSAAFELADQIAAGVAPPPARIVLAVGSICTAAGLLAGLALAEAVGVWRWPVPIVHGVRVTPWPVTSRLRTADLARRTLHRVEQLGGPRVPIGLRALISRIVIDGKELGRGYGRPTPASDAATQTFADAERLDLSTSRAEQDRAASRLDPAASRVDSAASRVDSAASRIDSAASLDSPASRPGGAHAPRTAQLDNGDDSHAPRLDGVYSAKAAAALLRLHRAGVGPLLLWSSKSSALLAPPTAAQLALAPPVIAHWLDREV